MTENECVIFMGRSPNIFVEKTMITTKGRSPNIFVKQKNDNNQGA